ncbi:hypothetical protein DFA_11304 [Cavenderia fasciculata]|uniref:F-box domain-containing protein n=1 Tax=Cavenderia fasciculata TaxID=261658 RepID=F4QC56_CACFS|nr:uncharacterized protein DFA_11304 [Cavenderia fasciculata]EGG13543.1 hypothetical protein DFA_11304 [Cavenderia fasciculata]|eukprot:XP_004350247.1 hypothetical protein DFA_11304 [Cavenderia fasciculata]
MNITGVSNIIVVHIISFLDPIDSICLTLTSKSFYYKREQFLANAFQFSNKFLRDHGCTQKSISNLMKMIEKDRFKQFNLKSFNDSIIRSIKNQLPSIHNELIVLVNSQVDPIKDNDISRVIVRTKDGVKDPIDLSFLPPSATNLVYDCKRPIVVGSIPSTIKKLEFGTYHNKAINNPSLIPSSVTDLILSNSVVSPGAIPSSVTTLAFGARFTHDLEPGSVPPNLKSLKYFRSDSSDPIPRGVVPDTVRVIEGIGLDHLAEYPPYLEKLISSTERFISSPPFPTSLTHLDITDWRTEPHEQWRKMIVTTQITHFKVYNYEHHMDSLPPNLTHLYIRYEKMNNPKVIFPKTLKSLSVFRFDIPIYVGLFPDNLESFTFSDSCWLLQKDMPAEILPRSCKLISNNMFGYSHNLEWIAKNQRSFSIRWNYLKEKIDFRFIGNDDDTVVFIGQHYFFGGISTISKLRKIEKEGSQFQLFNKIMHAEFNSMFGREKYNVDDFF